MSEHDRDKRSADTNSGGREAAQPAASQGVLDMLVERLGPIGAHKIIQRRLAAQRADAEKESAPRVQAAADQGTSGASGALPHLETIQKSFGNHDVSGIKAHVDGAAAKGAAAMGAEAYATGDHVAFAGAPSLHTAAHEAAHVVQQRGGVQLKGGVGQEGDEHERHADRVADRVVAGQSVEFLLGPSPKHAEPWSGRGPVQAKIKKTKAEGGGTWSDAGLQEELNKLVTAGRLSQLQAKFVYFKYHKHSPKEIPLASAITHARKQKDDALNKWLKANAGDAEMKTQDDDEEEAEAESGDDEEMGGEWTLGSGADDKSGAAAGKWGLDEGDDESGSTSMDTAHDSAKSAKTAPMGGSASGKQHAAESKESDSKDVDEAPGVLDTGVAVQLLITGGKITGVNLPTGGGNRPYGLFGDKEMSHTSAWSLVVEAVRQKIAGRDLPKAAQAVGELLGAAMALPGMKRADALEWQQDYLDAARDAAERAAKLAIAQPAVSTIQSAISALLAFRNLIPLSAVDLGAPASQKGESDAVGVIRNYKSNSKVAVREAIFALLDKETLIAANQCDDEDVSAIPGAREGEKSEGLVADMVMQHLQTVVSGLPDVLGYCGLDREAVRKYLAKSGESKTAGGKKKREVEGMSNAREIAALSTIPASKAAAGGMDVKDDSAPLPPSSSMAVQVLIRGGTVSDVAIGSRPHGLFSGEKKHTTSFIAIADGVKRVVRGKEPGKAAAAVFELYQEAVNLPGAQLTAFLSPEQAQRVGQAKAEWDAVVAAMSKDQSNVDLLQRLIAAYLTFRNALPLSVVDACGEGPGGKGEKEHSKVARAPAGYDPHDVRDALWGLLDGGAASAIAQLAGNSQGKKRGLVAGKPVDADLPGADLTKQPEERLGAVIRQHLMTMRTSYPDAFGTAKLADEDSVVGFLKANGFSGNGSLVLKTALG